MDKDKERVIEINDDYVIRVDPYCLILAKKQVSKRGENIGTEYYRNISFHGTVKDLLKSLVEFEIKQDISLLENLERISEMIDSIDERFSKYDFGERKDKAE